MLIFINGRFIDEREPCLLAQDRGFRFGDGLFETIAVHNNVPYQWEFHLRRLREGLCAIRLELDVSSLRTHCEALLARNAMPECLLRISISRGVGSRGYLPLPEATPTLLIETLPNRVPPSEPVTLWLSTIEKISLHALPVRYKLAQGLNATLARLEAEDHDCFDALQCNAAGELCETTSASLLWLADDVLHAPALSCGTLEGSTRHTLLVHSPWPVKEGAFPPKALRTAHGVVVCNAAYGVLAVASLRPLNYHWNSVAMAQQLSRVLQEDIKQHCGSANA